MKDEDKTKEQLIDELAAMRQQLQLLVTLLFRTPSEEDFLVICADCKKIRDGRGHWQVIETYLQEHFGTEFSHTFCPECLPERYLEIENFVLSAQNT